MYHTLSIEIASSIISSFLPQNVELENRRRKAAQARIPSDPNAWQQMRENFEAIVLEDHAFSEQHEIEYALWQLHYRRIEELRAHFNAAVASAGSNPAQNGKGPSGSSPAQNGKGPSRGGPDRVPKIRAQFKTFLSEATGFYHDLMLKIRAKYGLSLGYFSDDSENQVPLSKDGNKTTEVKKGLISCHRCLIYLGDLARYKGLYGEGESKARDFSAASSYYMQATSLCPSSGNPHHQVLFHCICIVALTQLIFSVSYNILIFPPFVRPVQWMILCSSPFWHLTPVMNWLLLIGIFGVLQ